MKGRWRRDRHLRRHPRMGPEKLEMLQHRMAGKADLAGDLDAFGLGLHAVKLDAALGRIRRDAVEAAEEIEMPPRTAEFAVGRELEADAFLLLDDGLDLAIFDRLEFVG